MSIVNQVQTARIDWSKYPSLNGYTTYREKAYLLLYVISNELGEKSLTASEIARILSKKFRKTTSHQAIRAALNPRIGDEVDTEQRPNGEIAYSILPSGVQSLGITKEEANEKFSDGEIIVPFEIVMNCKDYIKKVVFQINGCYRDSYFDACAVMIRRFFETLIIEIYESKKLESNIKDTEGNYYKLNKLIKEIINENKIHLSSQTKNHLTKIKLFGDTGAHARKINLKKIDIKGQKEDIRLSAEELVNETC